MVYFVSAYIIMWLIILGYSLYTGQKLLELKKKIELLEKVTSKKSK